MLRLTPIRVLPFSNIKCRTNILAVPKGTPHRNSEAFVDHLRDLNKRNERASLDNKREAVRNLFGDEVANEIKSFRLAVDLVFLHNYYLSKVGMSPDDKRKMREYVIIMYELDGPLITPIIHDTIVTMMKKCNVL